jgi:hypothetical protein
MSENEKLYEGFRDAIHVPYVMVKCDTALNPADKCSLRGGEGETLRCVKWMGRDDEPMWHGIAAPFSEVPMPAGMLFPLFIRKECFARLRHDFEIEVHDRGGTDTCHSVCDIW